MSILLIDNFDSFTYNLLHYLEEVSLQKVVVKRNDELANLNAEDYSHIVISPGPGLPHESGDLLDFIKKHKDRNVLGVCLGQQAIAKVFGMKLKQLSKVVHGQAIKMYILDPNEELYEGLPSSFKVGRYHSWVIDPATMSSDFIVTATDDADEIMSISHKSLRIKAVQFHPESILTEYGKQMILNWLES